VAARAYSARGGSVQLSALEGGYHNRRLYRKAIKCGSNARRSRRTPGVETKKRQIPAKNPAGEILGFRQAFDRRPVGKPHNQRQDALWPARQFKDTEAAHFQKAADGRRRTGQKPALIQRDNNLIVGLQGGGFRMAAQAEAGLVEETQAQVGFSRTRGTKDQDTGTVEINAGAVE
jgi:hypothetical protein